jgi:hypothetical protein
MGYYGMGLMVFLLGVKRRIGLDRYTSDCNENATFAYLATYKSPCIALEYVLKMVLAN